MRRKIGFTIQNLVVVCIVALLFFVETTYAEAIIPKSVDINRVTELSESLYNTEELYIESDYYSQLVGSSSEEELIVPQQDVKTEGPGWSTFVDAIWRVGDTYYNVSSIATWISDNPEIAQVEQGRILGQASGNTQIRVRFKEKEYSFPVNIGSIGGKTASKAAGRYTASQAAVLNRALGMIQVNWTPSRNLMGWRGAMVFQAGKSYSGIPYSQSPNQRDLAGFQQELNTDDFYANYVRGDGIVMPKYGNDCSGFLSIAWGIRRYTTSTFRQGIVTGVFAKVGNYDPNNPSEADLKNSYRSLKSGDAIVKPGHVILVESVNGETVTCYEQTPYYAQVTTHTFPEMAKARYMPFSFLDSTNKVQAGVWQSSSMGTNANTGGWKKAGNNWTYVDGNGKRAVGWREVGRRWYYFNSSGIMLKGWQKIGGLYYYLHTDGGMASNEWVLSNNKWYYLGRDGRMLSREWIQSSGKWYYLRSSGEMATNYWRDSAGAWYYLGSNGEMVRNKSLKIGNKTYKFDGNGKCLNP